jgi:hypothetical protein
MLIVVGDRAPVRRAKPHSCICPACRKPFRAVRADTRFCSDACRKAEKRLSRTPAMVVRDVRDNGSETRRNSKVFEWPSGLRRMPPGSRLNHDRPYGPFGSREEWREWAEQLGGLITRYHGRLALYAWPVAL